MRNIKRCTALWRCGSGVRLADSISSHGYDFLLVFYCHVGMSAFSALILLVGRQEEHPACKN